MKCVVFHKKTALIILCFFVVSILFATVFSMFSKNVASPKTKYTVVIDAGHGGIDGGSVGKSTDVEEAKLNLDYAFTLKDLMQDYGFSVVMTRTSDSGLYSPLAKNKKKDDMKKRKNIVESSNADFVISIHMNSFPSQKARGAQVFYGKDDEPSQHLANSIQKHLIDKIEYAKQTVGIGDYYILNAIKAPSVLVECGFLSNTEEENLLIKKEYREQFCYCILLGILSYLN